VTWICAALPHHNSSLGWQKCHYMAQDTRSWYIVGSIDFIRFWRFHLIYFLGLFVFNKIQCRNTTKSKFWNCCLNWSTSFCCSIFVMFFSPLCGTPDMIYRSIRHWLSHKLMLTFGLHLAHKPKFPLHFMMYLLFAESTFSGTEGKRECGHQ